MVGGGCFGRGTVSIGRKQGRDSGGRDRLFESSPLRLWLRGRMAGERALLGELGYVTCAEVNDKGSAQWQIAVWAPLEDPGTLGPLRHSGYGMGLGSGVLA